MKFLFLIIVFVFIGCYQNKDKTPIESKAVVTMHSVKAGDDIPYSK